MRAREPAEQLVARMGRAFGIVLRGTGAVTVGADIGQAVTRMHLRERSAETNLRALAAGEPRPLSATEVAARHLSS